MLAKILSELRRYEDGLTVAKQHLHQLEPDIRSAMLGNAGTFIGFRVRKMRRTRRGNSGVYDLTSLPNRDLCTKLPIDSTPSRSFRACSPLADAYSR